MPYILKDRRDAILNGERPKNPGELNFVFSVLVNDYLDQNGLNYQNCNDIVGALDNAKDEFKRRVQDPYEDKKIAENGDVYDLKFV